MNNQEQNRIYQQLSELISNFYEQLDLGQSVDRELFEYLFGDYFAYLHQLTPIDRINRRVFCIQDIESRPLAHVWRDRISYDRLKSNNEVPVISMKVAGYGWVVMRIEEEESPYTYLKSLDSTEGAVLLVCDQNQQQRILKARDHFDPHLDQEVEAFYLLAGAGLPVPKSARVERLSLPYNHALSYEFVPGKTVFQQITDFCQAGQTEWAVDVLNRFVQHLKTIWLPYYFGEKHIEGQYFLLPDTISTNFIFSPDNGTFTRIDIHGLLDHPGTLSGWQRSVRTEGQIYRESLGLAKVQSADVEVLTSIWLSAADQFG